MIAEPAPIALFVYNRPELTARTLDCLKKNEGADRSLLYIFCDGPRAGATPQQLDGIRRVRELVRQQPWCGEVHVREAEKNLGLANSIIAGVSTVVEKHGRVIVLEDDLSLSPWFLRFMNEALEMYEREKKVLAIHGYLYPVDLPGTVTEQSFFVRDPGNLGWATWAHAWELFEPDSRKLYDLLRLKGLGKAFNFWGGYPFMRMLKQQMAGKVDSWAIRWRAVAYLHDKYTLHPVRSLVRHEGNVPEATHYHIGENDFLHTEISEDPLVLEKIPVVNREEVEHAFGRFLKKHSGMSLGSKIKSRLKKMIHR